MRTGLTVLAIFLIVTLTAALVGPHFVDWSRQRGLIEAQLGRVLGDPVTIRGAIDLQLLPTPFLVADQIEVADARSGEVVFSCDEMALSLGLTSLARGELRFTQAGFTRPTLRLARAPDGALALPRLDLAERSGAIAFDRIVVRDGRLRLADPAGGAPLALGGIDFEAEAGSLLGPFKVAGAAPGPADARIAFSLASGAVEGSRLRVKAVLGAGAGLPSAELDGALSFAEASSSAGAAALGYAGAATISGSLRTATGLTPWRAAGALKANLREATFTDLEVRIGGEERALSAAGTAQAQFGAAPRLALALAAKQLNLDALLRRDRAESATPAQAFEALDATLAALGAGAAPPLALSIDLATPAAILGGDTVTDVAVSATVAPGAPILGTLEASPPGRSHILASGTVEFGAAAGFKGRLDASFGDLGRFREWLAAGAPELAARLDAVGAALPYRSASMAGDVDLSAAGFAARNLKLVLERSTLAGSLAATRTVGADRARLFMDLRTDSLDIDALPNIGASGDFLRDVDLSLALEARAIHIARLGESQVDGGSLTLALTRTGEDLRLERFSIADLGGASVEATGAIGAQTRALSARIDAARLADFASLVHRVAPGAPADLLVDRAGALSPARLTFSAAGQGSGGDALPVTMTVDGMVGVTRLGAKFERAGGGALNAAITLDAPDAAPLLRQIGLPALSLVGRGAGHLAASVHGRWGGELGGEFAASLAGSDIAWRGRLAHGASDNDGAQMEGIASVKTGDAAPLLATLGVAASEGDPAIPVDLSAATVWRGDRLELANLQGALGRARVSGALTFRPSPPAAAPPADPDVVLARSIAGEGAAPDAPQLEGALSVDRLPLSALTGLGLGAPQPSKPGAIWSDARFLQALVNPPTAAITLRIGALDVTDRILGRDASVRLGLGRGLVALDDFSMHVAGGAVAGRATIRRDGPDASLSGQISIEPVAIDRPDFGGRLSGAMDFASSGQSVGALVAGLAGTGQIRLAGARLPHLDQDSLGRILDKAQTPDYPIDETNVAHALDLELARQPMAIVDAAAPATLTSGVVRAGPFAARTARDDAQLRAEFDLRQFTFGVRAVMTEQRSPKFWTGSAPSITVAVRSAGDAPVREIDAGLFAAGLASQAIARAIERNAAIESDIRERAFFNRRLKAGQAMRRRELELDAFAVEQARLKSEADRRRVETEALRIDDERRAALAPQVIAAPPAPSASAPLAEDPAAGDPPPAGQPAPSPQRPPEPTPGGLY